MFTLKIQPEGGQLYELTHNYCEFEIVAIDGLDPPLNTVNISAAGIQDGGRFNSSRLNPRNVVITAVLFGDIEASRQKLYKIFRQKSPVSIYFRDKNRNLKTVGYVEQHTCNPFEQMETAQISLLCPDPYWHGVDEVTAEITAFEDTTITNPGDVSTGFCCEISVTGTAPPVTLAEYTDDLAVVYPPDRNLFLRPMSGDTLVQFDPDTQIIGELTTAGTDLTGNITTTEMITKQDGILGSSSEDYIRIELDSSMLSMGTIAVRYAIASITGGSAENVKCTAFVSSYFSNSISPYIPYCTINFMDIDPGVDYDETIDVCKLYMRNAQGWQEMDPSDYSLEVGGGTIPLYAHFGYNLRAAGYTEGKFVVYRDTTGANIKNTLVLDYYEETRNTETDWSANIYDSVPAGYDPALDVAYVDGERTQPDAISSCYLVPGSGGSVETYSVILGSPGTDIEFRYVESLTTGTDITGYTEDQIEAGLAGTAYVHELTLWNNTTGLWMQFRNVRFQLGDVIEISTVPGELSAKITERSGEPADISLLYDVYKNGYFFKIDPGDNVLTITAAEQTQSISANLTFETLYGGA